MTSKQKCTEHAQATLGRLRELTEGCEVVTESGNRGAVIYGGDKYQKWVLIDGERRQVANKYIRKIIGHTPTLGDWLELLGMKYKELGDPIYCLTCDGELSVFDYKERMDKPVGLNFNLATNEPDNWDTLAELLNL